MGLWAPAARGGYSAASADEARICALTTSRADQLHLFCLQFPLPEPTLSPRREQMEAAPGTPGAGGGYPWPLSIAKGFNNRNYP